jgi:hypothetical protein
MSPIADVLPLSPMQEGLLFHSLYADTTDPFYVLQMTVDIHGDLDEARLRGAVREVVRRHSALRTAIGFRDSGEPVQVVRHAVAPAWRSVDATGGPLPDVLDRSGGRAADPVRPGPPQ